MLISTISFTVSFGSTALCNVFPPSTHDARCYSSQCVCSLHICHKCSLCNSNSQPGLLLSCLPPSFPRLRIRNVSSILEIPACPPMKDAWVLDNTRSLITAGVSRHPMLFIQGEEKKKIKDISHYNPVQTEMLFLWFYPSWSPHLILSDFSPIPPPSPSDSNDICRPSD